MDCSSIFLSPLAVGVDGGGGGVGGAGAGGGGGMEGGAELVPGAEVPLVCCRVPFSEPSGAL